MKKYIAFLLLSIFLMVSSGCEKRDTFSDNGKINIVCTIFPVYDWVNEIIGEENERFSVNLLGDGWDLHNFQPSAADISKLYDCDLFISVGGISEQWTDKISFKDNAKTVKLLDFLEESDKLIAGHNEAEHHHEGHSNDEVDEHIWLSLRLSSRMINGLCEELCALDPENGVIYKRNTAAYNEELGKLNNEYITAVNASNDKTVIFADRFPFAYMMKDYGITCFAAFPGCSTDSDASFETIAILSEKVRDYGKDTVLVLENSGETVVDAINSVMTEQKIEAAVMNSCQYVGSANIDALSYIDIMSSNLIALKKALE